MLCGTADLQLTIVQTGVFHVPGYLASVQCLMSASIILKFIYAMKLAKFFIMIMIMTIVDKAYDYDDRQSTCKNTKKQT